MNSYLALLFEYGPKLVEFGINVAPLLKAAYDQLTEGRNPTPDEWLLLDAHTDADLAKLVARAKEAQAELARAAGTV